MAKPLCNANILNSTIAASIARLVCFINAGKLLAKNDPDLTCSSNSDCPKVLEHETNSLIDYVAPTAYWVVIECSLAIVSACLPVLRPIFHGRSIDTIFRSIAKRFSTRDNSTGNSKQSVSYGNLKESSSTTSLRRKPGFSANAAAMPESYALETELTGLGPARGIMIQKRWGNYEDIV